MGYIRVHPVSTATTLARKADTAVIEFDDKDRAERIILKAGEEQSHSVAATEVRYLTGTDEEPTFRVQAVSPGRQEDPVEATGVLLAHDVPIPDWPNRKLHYVEVFHRERRMWARSCVD